jgi:hypothetical protein
MQCACAVLSSVVCPTVLYFSTLSHKRHDFRGKILLNIKCMFLDFLYKFCLQHFSFQDEFCKILSQMSIDLRVKYPLFWSDFNEPGIFLDMFLKNTRISNFMKILPARDDFFFRAGRGRDRHNEANSSSSKFCEGA